MAPKIKYPIGYRQGKLTLTKREGKYYVLQCDCGTEKRHQSMLPTLRSCGCTRYEQRVSYEDQTINFIFHVMKNDVKRRKSELREAPFTLTFEQFKELIFKPCVYCGAEKINQTKYQRGEGTLHWNGVDRVDSSKGYTIDNVVPCCKICNRAKGTKSVEEFRSWLQHTNEFQKTAAW
jgi:phosphopantetheine adenylyltransferase